MIRVTSFRCDGTKFYIVKTICLKLLFLLVGDYCNAIIELDCESATRMKDLAEVMVDSDLPGIRDIAT